LGHIRAALAKKVNISFQADSLNATSGSASVRWGDDKRIGLVQIWLC